MAADGRGLVNGVFGNRMADPGDSIWTVPVSWSSKISVKGETAVIESNGAPHVYNIRTGETLELSQTAPDWSSWSESYLLSYTGNTQSHASPRDDWHPLQNMTREWVKDRGGRRLLWLPVEWRVKDPGNMEWFPDIAIIQLRISFEECITIKLY